MEHRLKLRVQVAYPARLTCRGSYVIEGCITDLSSDGAFFSSAEADSTRIKGIALVEFLAGPGHAQRAIEMHAMVIHIQRGRGVGLMFLGPKLGRNPSLPADGPPLRSRPAGDQEFLSAAVGPPSPSS